jgi:hypothetical protein
MKRQGRPLARRFPALMATQYVSGLKKSRAALYFFYKIISVCYDASLAAAHFPPDKNHSLVTQP